MDDSERGGPFDERLQFDLAAHDPDGWLAYADNLLLASRFIRERVAELKSEREDPSDMRAERVHAPELMLRAFALEGLLKGLRVKQGVEIARDGRLVGGTHDLVALYRAANLPSLNDGQTAVLRKLERYATHWGRYPVASCYERQEWEPGTGMIWHGAEDDITDGLIAVVREKLVSSS